MKKHGLFLVALAASVGILSPTPVRAAIIPFTEEFAADASDWRDSGGALLNWIPSGGPDGGSYASADFNFVALPVDATPALHRAQDEFNSSGNAFVGDWITEGVTQFSVFVRHDAPVPLTYFTRFSGPGNFPGVAAVNFVPVPANTWTQILIPIVPGNPQFFFEGPPSTFNSVFGSVGHVQVGVTVPQDLAGVDQTFRFDLDKPSIVPEPAAGLLLLAPFFARVRPRNRFHLRRGGLK